LRIVFNSESRYLLILTENYAALGILQQELLKIKNAIIIFGSSFPKDQEYTQVRHTYKLTCDSLSCKSSYLLCKQNLTFWMWTVLSVNHERIEM